MRRLHNIRTGLVAALLAAGCDGSSTDPVPVDYEVIPLGLSAEEAYTYYARGLNDLGQVLLASYPTGGSFGLWDDGWIARYNVWTGRLSGLNNHGAIVGGTGGWSDSREVRPFVARAGGVWYLAGDGLERAIANAVNDAGVIVGATDHPSTGRAFIWTGSGVVFPELPGVTSSSAAAVNELGEVVLQTQKAACMPQAACTNESLSYLWSKGTARKISAPAWSGSEGWTLVPEFSPLVRALDLNDAGQVVGTVDYLVQSGGTRRNRQRAFRWQNGVTTDLGIDGAALKINEAGHVLLAAPTPSLWVEGRVIDLTETVAASGWRLTYAFGLNDRGQILASGTHPQHAPNFAQVLLEPLK